MRYRPHALFVVLAVVLTQGCKPRKDQQGSATKDFSQIHVLTQTSAICRDGSVYAIAKNPDQPNTYAVTRPDGQVLEVPEDDLLQAVCPLIGALSQNLLRQGTYISIKGEDGQKERCDMKIVSTSDAQRRLLGVNASAPALESDNGCTGNVNIYSFACSGEGPELACTGRSNSGQAIILTKITPYSFERLFDRKSHTYVNIDASPQASGNAAVNVQAGTYKPSSSSMCNLEIRPYYDGPNLSHVVAQRSCAIAGRNVYACLPTANGPECTSIHGESRRKLKSFTGTAFKYVSTDGRESAYSLQ